MISADTRLGRNATVYHPELVNLYGCEIGDNTQVGAFVEIGKSVKIGKNCKIHVFVGPHACFTNDRFPRATGGGRLRGGADWQVEPTLVRDDASIGANATILCGVTIGRKAIVAAGSMVTRYVPNGALVAGNPARVIRTMGGGVPE